MVTRNKKKENSISYTFYSIMTLIASFFSLIVAGLFSLLGEIYISCLWMLISMVMFCAGLLLTIISTLKKWEAKWYLN
jgi:uncharacterized Tic20 family protein